MVTRREEVARLAEAGGDNSPAPGPVRVDSASEGDLFGLLQGSGTEGVKKPSGEPDPIPTRVKAPAEKEPKGKATRPTPRTASERELAVVGENLEEKIGVIFGLASGIAPVTSVYAIDNSPKAIHALLEIAKRRPAILKALTQVADGANALEIGKFLLGILVCIQVDTGRLEGTELQARAFGVTEILERHFQNPDYVPADPENPGVVKQDVPHTLRFSAI